MFFTEKKGWRGTSSFLKAGQRGGWQAFEMAEEQASAVRLVLFWRMGASRNQLYSILQHR